MRRFARISIIRAILKSVENTRGGVLLSVKLPDKAYNLNKSKASP